MRPPTIDYLEVVKLRLRAATPGPYHLASDEVMSEHTPGSVIGADDSEVYAPIRLFGIQRGENLALLLHAWTDEWLMVQEIMVLRQVIAVLMEGAIAP